MDNNNGALSFDVLIRDSNINTMLTKDEQRIMQFADNVEGQSNNVVGSFNNIGKAVAGVAMGATLQGWVRDVISVRGEFQQLGIAFTTILGSAEQANSLMSQLTTTAASTPFDLKGIANSAKQLLAYGESADHVNETLVRLGNIASGLSVPLNDLTYLYGTTMVQGRLYAQDVQQFMGRGIPLVQELAKHLGKTNQEIKDMVSNGEIGFEHVRMVIENLTNEGGMFYGLMEEQSKSLTGQISNLGDAFDSMLNEIGASQEGILSGSISSLTYLVVHYEDCIHVLGGMISMYGTYKVALASVAIAQGKSTGIAALDNITLKVRAGLLNVNTQNGMQLVRTTQQMTASQQAYTLELQKTLTAEQQEQILRNVKIAAITQLLTAEQQQFVSRSNLNVQSVEYLALLESVLTSEQRAALSKKNLTASSMAYSVAVQQAVQATQGEIAAQLAAVKAEGAALKQKQLQLMQEYRTSKNKIEQTRVQIALAQSEGNATAAAALKQKQYTLLQQHAVLVKNMDSAASQRQAVSERAATLAKRQGAIASRAAAASNTMLATTKSFLSLATAKLVGGLRALWATMMANPITAIISLVGMAASAFLMFGKKTEEETTIQGEFQDALGDTYNQLNTYFAILKGADSSSKVYKETLSKINKLCGDHHVALLKENAAMDEQVKKHDELIEAIESETAAKLKAKYVEQAMQTMYNDQKETLKELTEAAEEATHKALGQTTEYNAQTGQFELVTKMVDQESAAIRDANAALWEGVISMAVEGSNELAGMSGEAYEKALGNLVERITSSVKDATHASENEMEEFAPAIENAVKKVVSATEQGQKQIQLVDTQVSALFESFGGTFNPKQTEDKVASVTMSFEELQKMAEDAQTEIDEINGKEVKVSADSTELDSALEKLAKIKGIIDDKEGSLNTEDGINKRIKSLKEMRAQTEIGSAAWKDYDDRIKALEERLPSSHKSIESAAEKAKREAEKAADAAKQAGDKVRDIELEVEKERLTSIKDSFERRQAELKLEHKRDLARIDKEQADLEKTYKNAKKPMPKAVKDNFNELRTLSNANYEVEQSKLLQEEMSHRKKQYTQYYSWIEHYGKEAADQQFSELISKGETYEAWLNGKVSALRNKMSSGGQLTLDEGNSLVNMENELNEIKGVKNAVDSFNESLLKTRETSATASDYIARLAAMKQDLMQGKTDLIGEDRAQAVAKVDAAITAETEQFQQQLLEKYKSNAQLRADVENEYQQEITWLQQHGYEQQAVLAENARVKAVSELQAQQLQSGDLWQEIFRSAEYLSGSAFDNIKEQLRALVEQIEDSGIKEGLLGQLQDLERQTQGGNNPFKKLVKSIKEYDKAADHTTAKKKAFKSMFEDIGNSADMVKQSFDSIVGGLKEMGLAGDEETQAMLGNISDMMGGAADLAKGISSMNPAQIISGGVSIITSAIKLFDKTSRRIKREMREHEKQLGVLQRMYAQVQYEVDNAVGEEYFTKQREAIKNLQKQKAEYEELARLEQSKKSKDRDDGKVQEYLQSAEDVERQILDIEKAIRETLVQTSFKDLANDLADVWAECFGKMEDSAEKFDEVWNKTIANAVKNSLKLKIIEPVINDFTNAMANHMGIHNNSLAGFDFAKWKKILQNAGEAYTEGLKGFEEFFVGMSDATDKAAETLEGQVANVTEETASAVAGEMTTMRIRQYEMLVGVQNIDASIISTRDAINNCIGYLQTIAVNTKYNSRLVEIQNLLTDIKANMNVDPLRSKGYNY